MRDCSWSPASEVRFHRQLSCDIGGAVSATLLYSQGECVLPLRDTEGRNEWASERTWQFKKHLHILHLLI